MEISRKVAEGSITEKSKPSKKGGAKHSTTAPAASLDSDAKASLEGKEALRREILSKLKERGRVKWRTLARALIASFKSAYSDNTIVIRATEKRSHFMLNIVGERSSDGATIVRPHGKADRTISAGEARGLADNLIDVTFRLMARRK